MKKFAQVYQGTIIYFEEAEDIKVLLDKYNPSTLWLDVTDIECGLGWNVSYDEECQPIIEAPPKPEPPTLEESKEMRKAHLKAKRDHMETAPVEYKGHCFDYQAIDRTRIEGAIHLMTAMKLPSVEWTLADNTKLPVTIEDLNAVKVRAELRSAELHKQYGVAKARLNKAKTLEEVEKVVL